MTKIYRNQRPLLISQLGAPNELPIFRWQQPLQPVEVPPGKTLSAEEVENRHIWGAASILPYQVLDQYNRSQQSGHLPAIVIENDLLRLTLYPGLGGRLASMYDKKNQREVLFDNPVFQPANLAILNAWFSGGIEWNGLIPGHSPFTCSPVFTATVETDKGPILRIYEFDRIREAAWQVDLYLPNDEAKLWIHVKIVNPNDYPVKCYWWTNIAVALDDKTRVFSPAGHVIEHVPPDNHLERFAFPDAHGYEGSYPHNYNFAASVFFRKPGLDRPWIASVGRDSRGLFHISTKELRGRKIFVFGNTPGGRHWMDYLSVPGRGDYIELQAGVMPTQDQDFIVPAKQTLEWTECLAPLDLDPEVAFHPDYQQACKLIEPVIEAKVPNRELQHVHQWLSKQADTPVSDVLQAGSAWGMLHERMTGRPVSPGLAFATTPTSEQLWAELLESGTFSETTLGRLPASWAVSDRWRAVLEESAAKYGTTWLHELLLGVIALDRCDDQAARLRFEASMRMQNNALVNRHLAIIAHKAGNIESAKKLYLEAWKQSGTLVSLAVEICLFMQKENLLSDIEAFTAQLPADIAKHERIQLAICQIAIGKGQFEKARRILDRDFSIIREGEVLPTNLWFALHTEEAEARLGREATQEERAAIVADNPPPYKIDFRMIKTECSHENKSPLV